MRIFNKQQRLNDRLADDIYFLRPVDKIAKVLDSGADIDSRDNKMNRSPIFMATIENQTSVIKFLLERGANPNPREENGATPLMKSIEFGNFEAVKELVVAGAELDARTDTGDCALLMAVRAGNEKIARFLVEHGADANIAGSNGSTALHIAAGGSMDKLVFFLVENGADVNVKGEGGNTPLHVSAVNGNGNIAYYLLKNAANTTIVNNNMDTPAQASERYYPRISAMLKGKTMPESGEGTVAPEAWRLTAENEVARVIEKPSIGYRVTEIFNFNARLYTQIARNIETDAESQTVKGFAEIDDGTALQAAQEALSQLGGRADAGKLDKKKLPQPGKAGARPWGCFPGGSRRRKISSS